MTLNTKRAKRARVAVTVTLPREALELADALADQRGITRSAVFEELVFAQLRPQPPAEPERARKLQESWNGWDEAEIEKELAPWPKPTQHEAREQPVLPSRQLFEAFSNAVANAGKGLPELRLTDVAALEEVLASARSVAGENAMGVFVCWAEAYVADAETPTPSGLLMNLHRYVMLR